MITIEPRTLKKTDVLKAAVEWSPRFERVSFLPGEDLPGSFRPLRGVFLMPQPDEDHIIVSTNLYDLDPMALKAALADLADAFIAVVTDQGLKAVYFAPLVQPPLDLVVYVPAEICGIPVRVMMAYSVQDQSFRLTLDAYAARRPR